MQSRETKQIITDSDLLTFAEKSKTQISEEMIQKFISYYNYKNTKTVLKTGEEDGVTFLKVMQQAGSLVVLAAVQLILTQIDKNISGKYFSQLTAGVQLGLSITFNFIGFLMRNAEERSIFIISLNYGLAFIISAGICGYWNQFDEIQSDIKWTSLLLFLSIISTSQFFLTDNGYFILYSFVLWTNATPFQHSDWQIQQFCISLLTFLFAWFQDAKQGRRIHQYAVNTVWLQSSICIWIGLLVITFKYFLDFSSDDYNMSIDIQFLWIGLQGIIYIGVAQLYDTLYYLIIGVGALISCIFYYIGRVIGNGFIFSLIVLQLGILLLYIGQILGNQLTSSQVNLLKFMKSQNIHQQFPQNNYLDHDDEEKIKAEQTMDN